MALSNSEDGQLLLEQLEVGAHRQRWLNGGSKIKSLTRNHRLINRVSVLAKCLEWCSQNSSDDSIPMISNVELELLARFPETF